MAESITLKWGTLKGWNGLDENGETLRAVQKYHDLGPVSMSVMTQRDTPDQKAALCEAIDACSGDIWDDWQGAVLGKEAAKKYVMEYGT